MSFLLTSASAANSNSSMTCPGWRVAKCQHPAVHVRSGMCYISKDYRYVDQAEAECRDWCWALPARSQSLVSLCQVSRTERTFCLPYIIKSGGDPSQPSPCRCADASHRRTGLLITDKTPFADNGVLDCDGRPGRHVAPTTSGAFSIDVLSTGRRETGWCMRQKHLPSYRSFLCVCVFHSWQQTAVALVKQSLRQNWKPHDRLDKTPECDGQTDRIPLASTAVCIASNVDAL